MFPPRPMTPSATLLTLLLGALGSGAIAGLLGTYGAELATNLAPNPRVDTVVVLGIVLLGAVVATWFACHLALGAGCLLAAALGRRWRAGERFVTAHGPALVRRAVATGLSISVGLGGVAATAQEPTLELGWHATTSAPMTTATASLPDLGWAPTPPRDQPVPIDHSPDTARHEADRAAPEEPEQPAAARRHVVVPGDTLWSVTRGWLDDPDDVAIAAAWPALYEANRDVIGADPDLIHPGQELTVPTNFEELP